MKILWVSYSAIGPAATILNEVYSGSSGGWIQSEYECLNTTKHEMFFLCSQKNIGGEKYIHKGNELGEVYCVNAPLVSNGIKNPAYLSAVVEEIIMNIKPDIIQIWGTETCLSNIVAHTKWKCPKVIFIQGLIGVHARYLGGYFSKTSSLRLSIRVNPFAKFKETVRQMLFRKQIAVEQDTIRLCGNVIIDSVFAESYCNAISSDITAFYHILRPNKVFKKHHWDINNIERHSIFTVYGSNAEKGLQQLLFATSIVKERYPDVCVIVPGPYQLDEEGNLTPSGVQSYEVVLKKLIEYYDLKENVRFVGRLSKEEMAEQIEHAHIFVNPSCMEVHALSLREALVEGTPCISSLCGGISEMILQGENGFFYRYEEYEVLAEYIKRIFSDDGLACHLSKKATFALKHLEKNGDLTLDEIYERLIVEDA